MAEKKNIKLQTVLEEPSQAALDLPFYNLLPKGEIPLLQFRLYVLERCNEDAEFREDIWAMCCKDVVFFAAMFCWLHETRDDAFTTTIGKFPFQPWTDQVDLLAWLQEYGGRKDICIEKTRGIGLSWVAVVYMLWKWLTYGEHLDYGILSKDDKSLDMIGRPATLMGKLDLLFENLPGWMQLDPDDLKPILHRTLSNHRFEHRRNHNAIIGYTSTDDKLRSARLNFVIVDEAAFLPVDTQRWLSASQFVTPSRIFISTHDGTATMFYRMSIDSVSRLVRISTWWQANPARWKGAYVVKKGQVIILDKTCKFPMGYDFKHDDPGLERSLWVDGEFEKTGVDKVSLMQEIYGTAAIATKRLFQKSVLEVGRASCTPAHRRCRLNGEGDFVEDLEGDFYFWQDEAIPFTGMYSVGVDPAIGVVDAALVGITAVDARTGHIAVSAGLANCTPVEAARAVEALCRLLCGPRGSGYAKVVHESTGIGVSFLTELKRLRWPNIYTDGTKMGIPNRDKGEKVLIEAGRAIADGELVITDLRVVDDFEHFEYNSKVELIFTGEVGHGDIGQATALAWWDAKVRRRAILDSEKVTTQTKQFPIEEEEDYRDPGQRRPWSDRFSLNS